MPDLISSLLPLHRIAASQGGGLHKELLTLLEKSMYRDEDVKILASKVTSIGPRNQDFADDEIAKSKCAKLNEGPFINR